MSPVPFWHAETIVLSYHRGLREVVSAHICLDSIDSDVVSTLYHGRDLVEEPFSSCAWSAHEEKGFLFVAH